MKAKTKSRMVQVELEPIAIRMMDRICKAEGLTRDEVFEALLQSILDRKEAKR